MRKHPALLRRGLYQAAMFAVFSAFWTTVSYPLIGPGFHHSTVGVGIFAFVGAAGALIAPVAGHWAARTWGRPMTGASFVVAAGAFALAGFGQHSIVAIAIAAILIDMVVQTTLILGQHTIYGLDPDARARLNSVFIATFFLGGALGSEVGSLAHKAAGWGGGQPVRRGDAAAGAAVLADRTALQRGRGRHREMTWHGDGDLAAHRLRSRVLPHPRSSLPHGFGPVLPLSEAPARSHDSDYHPVTDAPSQPEERPCVGD
ncbi:hypothetical protein ACFVT5_41900 [Streptomyces sp. NPDC058001]|uniref:hypothetical protein n=1 Tax=Streptomyces sp. NPDC058001 TaxID=3346300 RepID=UPI0036E52108